MNNMNTKITYTYKASDVIRQNRDKTIYGTCTTCTIQEIVDNDYSLNHKLPIEGNIIEYNTVAIWNSIDVVIADELVGKDGSTGNDGSIGKSGIVIGPTGPSIYTYLFSGNVDASVSSGTVTYSTRGSNIFVSLIPHGDGNGKVNLSQFINESGFSWVSNGITSFDYVVMGYVGGWTPIATPIYGTSAENLGRQVSLSGDGNIFAVTSNDYVYIYSSDGTDLTLKKTIPVVTTGNLISFSYDGTILTITDNDNCYIYSGTDWNNVQTIVGNTGDYFGSSVSISDDGTIIAIGASYTNSHDGCCYIYSFGGLNYTYTTTISGSGGEELGTAVSLSEDGTTIVVGASNNNSGKGSCYIYSFDGTSCTLEKTINGSTNENLGNSVSISADGKTVAIGSPLKNIKGCCYIYSFDTSWNLIYTINGNNHETSLGYSVSVSSDGTIIAISSNNVISNGYVYSYDGTEWTYNQIYKSTYDGGYEAIIVSLSNDGKTLVNGIATNDNNSNGKCTIYNYI
jgi:hypothetical protein